MLVGTGTPIENGLRKLDASIIFKSNENQPTSNVALQSQEIILGYIKSKIWSFIYKFTQKTMQIWYC